MISLDQQTAEIKDMIYRHEASIKLIHVKMSSFLQDIVGIEYQLIKEFESQLDVITKRLYDKQGFENKMRRQKLNEVE